jgi:DNA-binding CsgD family transcriptional regulator
MYTCTSFPSLESARDVQPGSVQRAMRDLLSLIEKTQSSQAENEAAEQVLVDTEVDGLRYLVIRMHAPVYGRVQLSPREQEIVRMVAQGHPNKVIADVLSISTWTVCTHLRRIFAKLGVCSRAAMVAQLPEFGVLGKEHHASLNHR